MSFTVIEGDVRDCLADIADGTVQTCITSPPYYGLRDYGTADQIGLESTPDEYVERLVDVFHDVRRALRDDGTLWLNLGDSYAGGGSGPPGEKSTLMGNGHQGGGPKRKALAEARPRPGRLGRFGLKQKDLLMIPAMVALALRADGWYLRSEIVWAKPNPMPESVRDRPTSSHEKIFLLSKSPRYFYDAEAIREAASESTIADARIPFSRPGNGNLGSVEVGHPLPTPAAGRNKRNVWEVTPQPYADAHFATFPPKLIEPMVLAGTSPQACSDCGAPWRRQTEHKDGHDGSRYGERAVAATGGAITGGTERSTLGSSNGKLTGRITTLGWEPTCEHAAGDDRCLVLDPFTGSGTTGVVCEWYRRDFIGVELNPEYAALARNRIQTEGAIARAPRRPRKKDPDQMGLL